MLPPPDGRALTTADAAAVCGCSVSHFERHIAPLLPVINLAPPGAKRLPRYHSADLQVYLWGLRQMP